MQLARLLADEERHRDTPLPLPRQSPIRPVLNHAVQPSFAPRWKKLRVFYTSKSCGAQRLTPFGAEASWNIIHRSKPLSRCAQDDGRLVSPAVHVAVHVRLL